MLPCEIRTIPQMPHLDSLQLRCLSTTSKDDTAALCRIILAAPGYSQTVFGRPPYPADATEILTELPPGKEAADKFVYGVYAGDDMIGCVDLIRGYPDAGTAHIGLLLLAESRQGSGLGGQTLQLIEQLVAGWHCNMLRIAVVSTNLIALRFWQKAGFTETGVRRKIENYIADAIVLDKPLAAMQ